jgi:hypothetical protein
MFQRNLVFTSSGWTYPDDVGKESPLRIEYGAGAP